MVDGSQVVDEAQAVDESQATDNTHNRKETKWFVIILINYHL